MSDDSILKNILSEKAISQEQLVSLSRNFQPDYGAMIARQQEEMRKRNEEIARLSYEGRQAFIHQLAQETAEENAKALRQSPIIFDAVIGALASLCGNPTYNTSSSEDSMNDYVRDILGQNNAVRDQTRQGRSGTFETAEDEQPGELDLQIRYNGRPIGIYEGLKLDSVVEKTIHDHIRKATVNYNPQGVKDVFVVAYVVKQSKKFGEFWNRFEACVRRYDDEDFPITWDDEEADTDMSAVRAIHGVYDMDDMNHDVYVIAVKVQE